jgi:hypothetical protein
MIGLNRITLVRRSLQRLALLMVPFSEVIYLTNQCSYRLTPLKIAKANQLRDRGSALVRPNLTPRVRSVDTVYNASPHEHDM